MAADRGARVHTLTKQALKVGEPPKLRHLGAVPRHYITNEHSQSRFIICRQQREAFKQKQFPRKKCSTFTHSAARACSYQWRDLNASLSQAIATDILQNRPQVH